MLLLLLSGWGEAAESEPETVGRLELVELSRVHARDLARASVSEEHRVWTREETR